MIAVLHRTICILLLVHVEIKVRLGKWSDDPELHTKFLINEDPK